MTFADLSAAKDLLFPSRYSNGYKHTTVTPNVIEVPVALNPVADDECVAQIHVYVAEIQSNAAKFKKQRTSERLEELLSTTDSFSAFLLDVIGDSGPGTPGTPVQGSGNTGAGLVGTGDTGPSDDGPVGTPLAGSNR